MRSDKLRVLALVFSAAAVYGCGQKGPLYLPDKTGNVVTRSGDAATQAPPEAAPAATPSPTTADSSSKEEEKKPK